MSRARTRPVWRKVRDDATNREYLEAHVNRVRISVPVEWEEGGWTFFAYSTLDRFLCGECQELYYPTVAAAQAAAEHYARTGEIPTPGGET